MTLTSISVPLSLIICIAFIVTSLLLKHYKEIYAQNAWCHESSVAAIFGLLVGGLIKLFVGETISFDSDLFFYLVLPPIIFSAGYSLKRKKFFRYGLTITVFGLLGTLINVYLTSAAAHSFFFYFDLKSEFKLTWIQSMLLASVLSASDEVSAMSLVRMKDYPRLGALIFGEGVLNDALSIVLFKSLLLYVQPSWPYNSGSIPPTETNLEAGAKLLLTVCVQLLLSCVIGIMCGLVNARFLKTFPLSRRHPVHQTSLVLLFGLLAYSLAECFGVSGILTLFVAAITLAHYSWHNLSKSAQISTKLSFNAMSDIAEGFAFAYVGLSMWQYTSSYISILFSIYMLFTVVVVRLFTILSICKIGSYLHKDFNIPIQEQLGFTLGGMVRGCLCWAQILQINGVDNQSLLITTTLFVVLVTTVTSGFILPVVMPLLVPELPGRRGEKATINTAARDNAKVLPYLPTNNGYRSTYVREPEPLSSLLNTNYGSITTRVDGNTSSQNSTDKDGTFSNSSHSGGGNEIVLGSNNNNNNNHGNNGQNGYTPQKDPSFMSTYSMHLDNTPDTVDHAHRLHHPLLQRMDVRNNSLYHPSLHHVLQSDSNNNVHQYHHVDTAHSNPSDAHPNNENRNNSPLSDTDQAGTTSEDLQTYSLAYVLWVRFDEIVMKPLFGGSNPDTYRMHILSMTQPAAGTRSGASDLAQSLHSRGINPSSLPGIYGSTHDGGYIRDAKYDSIDSHGSQCSTSLHYLEDEENDNLFNDSFVESLTLEEFPPSHQNDDFSHYNTVSDNNHWNSQRTQLYTDSYCNEHILGSNKHVKTALKNIDGNRSDIKSTMSSYADSNCYQGSPAPCNSNMHAMDNTMYYTPYHSITPIDSTKTNSQNQNPNTQSQYPQVFPSSRYQALTPIHKDHYHAAITPIQQQQQQQHQRAPQETPVTDLQETQKNP